MIPLLVGYSVNFSSVKWCRSVESSRSAPRMIPPSLRRIPSAIVIIGFALARYLRRKCKTFAASTGSIRFSTEHPPFDFYEFSNSATTSFSGALAHRPIVVRYVVALCSGGRLLLNCRVTVRSHLNMSPYALFTYYHRSVTLPVCSS